MFERPKSGERAVLVHVTFRNVIGSEDFQELKELALSADFLSVANVTTLREKPDPKYFIGKGKCEEILKLISLYEAGIVIFNHELTPSQERNVERYVKCRVLSRTGLILNIFAKRARTYEGKLQVELAQLEHLSTRLVRGWTHLERQKGGIGLRGGPGETQLEADRRLLRERIVVIQNRLKKVKQQREQSRHARQRAEILTVALVGYTNAGKSTLFNAITGSHVWVADQLFATLDPTLRVLELDTIGKIVLADTVGFIRQLPHTLVEAFRATLEETCQASLLLHIVDASDEKYEENIHQVNQVLAEIGAQNVPQLLVFNKSDLLNTAIGHQEYDENGKVIKIWISALKEQGLDLLQNALESRLNIEKVAGVLHLSPTQGKLRSELYELHAVVKETVSSEGECDLVIKTTKNRWKKLCQQYAGLSEAFTVW